MHTRRLRFFVRIIVENGRPFTFPWKMGVRSLSREIKSLKNGCPFTFSGNNSTRWANFLYLPKREP